MLRARTTNPMGGPIMDVKRTAFARHYGWLCLLLLTALIAGCGSKSEIISGTGDSGVESDGGALSAAFAGTYTGTILLNAKGSRIDSSDTSSAVLVVRTDGTAQLTIDGDNVIEGFMNGRSFGFSVVVIENEGGVKCDANALLTGSINGAKATGTVNGSGDCSVLTATTGFEVTGSMNLTRN